MLLIILNFANYGAVVLVELILNNSLPLTLVHSHISATLVAVVGPADGLACGHKPQLFRWPLIGVAPPRMRQSTLAPGWGSVRIGVSGSRDVEDASRPATDNTSFDRDGE
jgi:hypothetical protein